MIQQEDEGEPLAAPNDRGSRMLVSTVGRWGILQWIAPHVDLNRGLKEWAHKMVQNYITELSQQTLSRDGFTRLFRYAFVISSFVKNTNRS